MNIKDKEWRVANLLGPMAPEVRDRIKGLLEMSLRGETLTPDEGRELFVSWYLHSKDVAEIREDLSCPECRGTGCYAEVSGPESCDPPDTAVYECDECEGTGVKGGRRR